MNLVGLYGTITLQQLMVIIQTVVRGYARGYVNPDFGGMFLQVE